MLLKDFHFYISWNQEIHSLWVWICFCNIKILRWLWMHFPEFKLNKTLWNLAERFWWCPIYSSCICGVETNSVTVSNKVDFETYFKVPFWIRIFRIRKMWAGKLGKGKNSTEIITIVCFWMGQELSNNSSFLLFFQCLFLPTLSWKCQKSVLTLVPCLRE